MVHPILLKKILSRIRVVYEDILLDKQHIREYPKYEAWLKEYLELDDNDKESIIKKFERAQSSAIVYGMIKKDKEIFVNQLGMFYIKPTTTDFYNALNRMTKDKEEGDYDFEEVKQSALEETRDLYIKRANRKKNAKNATSIKILSKT